MKRLPWRSSIITSERLRDLILHTSDPRKPNTTASLLMFVEAGLQPTLIRAIQQLAAGVQMSISTVSATGEHFFFIYYDKTLCLLNN